MHGPGTRWTATRRRWKTIREPEPLPWADFWIDWGRVLAAHGRDPTSAATIDNVRHVLEEAKQIGMQPAIPALQRALSGDTGAG